MAKADRPEDHPEKFAFNLFEIPAIEAREEKMRKEKEKENDQSRKS